MPQGTGFNKQDTSYKQHGGSETAAKEDPEEAATAMGSAHRKLRNRATIARATTLCLLVMRGMRATIISARMTMIPTVAERSERSCMDDDEGGEADNNQRLSKLSTV